MSDALELEINEFEHGAYITHTVKILHQRYRGMCFGDGRHADVFTASNGFRIRSVDVPEARQKNYPTARRGNSNNVLFVRGRHGDDDGGALRVTSISYIAALRIAVKEYNDQFKEGG